MNASLLTWPLRLLGFGTWYVGQVISSNLVVVRDIFTRVDRSTPLVLQFPTRCQTEVEVGVLNVLISLTPGTLVLATQEGAESYVLYVHAMYDTREEVARQLAGLESRLLHALRPKGVSP